MSRDAYDDRYDDNPDQGYDDGEGGNRNGAALAIAQGKASTAGMVLMMFGFFSLFWAAMNMALMVLAPDVMLKPMYNFIEDMQKGQPGAKMPPYEDFVRSQKIQSIVINSIYVLMSAPIILAGMKMRKLQSYGLAMTGTIMALIPCVNSCCFIGMPVGIWALIVLINADVKEGFRLTAQRATGY